jgi:hypothetical protein
MATIKGDELILYTFEDLEPIGCEDSFILTLTATEIITTTKGSGRATNREYGPYDWTIQCTGVITINETGKSNPLFFNDNLIKGKKVAVKASVGSDFYFGMGIVTSASNTGTSGEFAKFDVTISADGPLHSTSGLQNPENEPQLIRVLNDEGLVPIPLLGYSSSSLLNATILMIFVNYTYYAPDTYEFIPNNGYGNGVLSFDFEVLPYETLYIYYVPA